MDTVVFKWEFSVSPFLISQSHGHCKNGIRCAKSHDPDAIQDADDDRDERRQRKRKRKKQKRQKAEAEESQPEGTEEEGEDGAKNDDGSKEDEGVKTDGMDVDDVKEDAILKASSHGASPQDTEKPSDSVLIKGSTNGDNITSAASSRTSPLKLNKQTGGHRAGYDAFMTGFTMATLASELSQRGSSSKTLKSEKQVAQFVEAFCLGNFKNKLFLSAKPVPLVIVKSSFAKTSQNHRDKMSRLGLNQS